MNNSSVYAVIGIITVVYLVGLNLFSSYKEYIYTSLLRLITLTNSKFLWSILPDDVQRRKFFDILYNEYNVDKLLQLCYLESSSYEELYNKLMVHRVLNRYNYFSFILSKYNTESLENLQLILEKLGIYRKKSENDYKNIHNLTYYGFDDYELKEFFTTMLKLKITPSDRELQVLKEYYHIEPLSVFLQEEDKYFIL
jgi:hypothetical protein